MEPSSELLLGRRSLEGIQGYELLEDLKWNSKHHKWVLQVQLSLLLSGEGGALGLVPDITQWHILVDATYPWGNITIYPSQDGGISDTFQHQNYNQNSTEHPWRTGNLCVNTSLRSFYRRGYDAEPYSASTRLAWHVERCKEWLKLADTNQLSTLDEPFELPHYPTDSDQVVAFAENSDTFLKWRASAVNAGVVDLKHLGRASQALFVSAFRGFTKGAALSGQWGYNLTDTVFNESIGIWIHLKSAPTLSPWKAPMTWGELYKATADQGINLEDLIKIIYQRAWKHHPKLLMLGFPIAAKVGGEPQQMHWLAIQLGKIPILKGFRKTSIQLPKISAEHLFHSKKQISWVATENWSNGEISTRGKISSSITEQSILIIGVGAVGSAFAEMFSRAGAYQLTVMDDDITEIGNMSRHMLTMDDLRTSKSKALANRLNKIFPHNKVNYINKNLNQELRHNKDLLIRYNIIIDATGSDDVLLEISQARHNENSKFISISLGLYARRIFCFTAALSNFIADDFRRNIKPWLIKESKEYSGNELPRDGTGCWHPLFPARVDDVWMLTSVAMKAVESYLINDVGEGTLTVFEQNYRDNEFVGISINKLDDYTI